MMGWNMGWGGGMFFGSFLGLLALVAVVVLVVMIARNAGMQGETRAHGAESKWMRKVESPLEILQTRYAKGEIDNEEFETRRRLLENLSESSG